MLINAWNIIRPTNWKLHIAGPNENFHQEEIQELINGFGLSSSISFIGEVKGKVKRNEFLSASLFILPSYSENFGVAIAEALSYGLPVITTNTTPWRELQKFKCGWWVEPSTDSISAAMEAAFEKKSSELYSMGLRGRKLIKENYSWDNIAQKIFKEYVYSVNAFNKALLDSKYNS